MRKLFRAVQFASYVATIIIAVALCLLVARNYSDTSSTGISNQKNSRSTTAATLPTRTSPIGKTVSLERLNWEQNKQTLVLYLSTQCKYCHESTPFYQRLVAAKGAGKNVKLTAVFSQPVEE